MYTVAVVPLYPMVWHPKDLCHHAHTAWEGLRYSLVGRAAWEGLGCREVAGTSWKYFRSADALQAVKFRLRSVFLAQQCSQLSARPFCKHYFTGSAVLLSDPTNIHSNLACAIIMVIKYTHIISSNRLHIENTAHFCKPSKIAMAFSNSLALVQSP